MIRYPHNTICIMIYTAQYNTSYGTSYFVTKDTDFAYCIGTLLHHDSMLNNVSIQKQRTYKSFNQNE